MSTTTASPLVDGRLWDQVIERADRRCECRTECGRTHKDAGGHCKHEHGRPYPLHAVPRDPAPSWSTAAALPAEALYALCPPCHTAVEARRRAVHSQATAAAYTTESLF